LTINAFFLIKQVVFWADLVLILMFLFLFFFSFKCHVTFSRAYSRFISITEYSGPLQVSSRVLREKIRMRAILKENTANYILVESLINVDFRKNMNCQFFLNSTK